MPTKLRYWKNPEHHRAESRIRLARLRANGISALHRLTPLAQEKRLESQRAYVKKTRKQQNRYGRTYRAKLKKLYGASGNHARWQYRMKRQAERIEKRKQATALPPKLVARRKLRNMAAGRQRFRRFRALNWLVL